MSVLPRWIDRGSLSSSTRSVRDGEGGREGGVLFVGSRPRPNPGKSKVEYE